MNQSDTINRFLNSVGLERRRSAVDFLWPAAGLVATGILVGAGLGLMFAPRPGAEIREGIRRRVGNALPGRGSSLSRTKRLEDMTREELYELAREQDIEGRSSMSRRELVETLSH